MGQGGKILLVNKTPYQWKKTHHHSYQMESWDSKFPIIIEPGTTASVYVEWESGAYDEDDAGEINYELLGTGGQSFQVQARNDNGYELKIFFINLSTAHHPNHTTLSLGWAHDGYVLFGLTGKSGSYELLANGQGHSSWMKNIREDKKLTDLTLPGTHDTCALYGGDLVQCQRMGLRDQLNAGIRFIDIRCRHFQDRFTIHHGNFYQHMNFTEVLTICLDFLKANNQETIIMSVKAEKVANSIAWDDPTCTRSFEQTFNWYLTEEQYGSQKGCAQQWYQDNKIPRLKDVRGKIVLFRRFETDTMRENKGISAPPAAWPDSETFVIDNDNNNGVTIKVQDQYKVPTLFNIGDKWDKVNGLLQEANNGSREILFVNFCSGVSGGAYPYSVAYKGDGVTIKGVNYRLLKEVAQHSSARYGIIPMDFPESPGNTLIPTLISLNEF